MWLLVGLGNPGTEYQDTRHNVGFHVIDLLAQRTRAPSARTKHGAEIVEARLGSERVLLCKPMEYMNVSGQPVVRVASFWKVEPKQTIVVHDDLDLPFGRLKLGAGGGHGGNNGVRSILTEWGNADFHRVRMGIGRPAPGRHAANHVLGGFDTAERAELPEFFARAADAVACIVTDGIGVAMNRFNGSAGRKPAKGDVT
ncbi:MAG TPA: aminoacyl-tRNA hydrolase [Polyangia bacterium]